MSFDWVRFGLQLGLALVLSFLVYRIGFIDGRIHEQKIFLGWIEEELSAARKLAEKPKRGRPKKQS